MTVLGAPDLADDLVRLGVREGDCLMVHGSMRAIGPAIGGARSVIEALIEAVGAPGTLVMPAYTRDALLPPGTAGVPPKILAEIEAQVPGFEPQTSSCHQLGALAEAFRTWPGVLRSRHPVHSMTALGPEARRIVSHHPRDWAFGLDGPMGRLVETGRARVLMLGVGWDRCSALHTAETIARFRRLRVLRFKDTTREVARWIHARDVTEDAEGLFPRLGAAIDAAELSLQGWIGLAEARLVDLDDMLAFAAPWIASYVSADAAATRGIEGAALGEKPARRRRRGPAARRSLVDDSDPDPAGPGGGGGGGGEGAGAFSVGPSPRRGRGSPKRRARR
ncbi:MAG: AAC(3) family N-acetyltransferase [Pseudomonadota bacterium]